MKKSELIEWIVIFVALVSFWPRILGYQSTWYRIWMVVVLMAMIVVTVRRVRHIRESTDSQHKAED
jgi:hypothetical protein